MNNKPRICVHCGEEYILTKNKPGYINECRECGSKSDQHTPKLGGVMEYAHKTAPTIRIVTLDDAKEIVRRTQRKSGTSIISGMSTTR